MSTESRYAPARSALAKAAAIVLPRPLAASVGVEIGVLLFLSLMFPFMIHLLPVPEDSRLGPRLLPMFYAPLLGALLGRARSAWTVALVGPWLNWLLTSHPVPPMAVVMTIQLAAFVGTLRWLLARLGARWFLAAPAYVAAMAAAALTAAVLPELIGGRDVLAWAAASLRLGLPGVGVLVAINWAVVRFYPSGPGGPSLAA